MRTFKASHSRLQRWACLCLAVIFTVTTVMPFPAQAQLLPMPGAGGVLVPSPVFTPPLIIGLKVFPDRPFQFDFILHPGQEKIQDAELKAVSQTLIKYFLTALTVPEDELWVNLSPSEQERMIPDALGMTEMGRDLLAQDYLLKQLTASFMFPDEKIGKAFWEKIQQRIAKEYPGVDVPVDTFHKVWIVPDRAELYQNGDSVVIGETHLRVMLEQDYFASRNNLRSPEHQSPSSPEKVLTGAQGHGGTGELTKEVIKEVIIPEIEKEVNQGKYFAQLRQIYYSMILATWYKRALHDSILGEAFADKNKIAGSRLEDLNAKEKIYDRYMQLFKDGVFDMIKEEYDPASEQVIPRHYFSGGFMGRVGKAVRVLKNSRLWQLALSGIVAVVVSVEVQGADLNGQRIPEPNDEINIKMDSGDLPVLSLVEMPGMIAKLSSPDELVRLEAAEKFNDYNYFGQAEAIEALRLRLADENPAVRRAALEALGMIAAGNQEAAEAVFTMIVSEKNSDVLKQAVRMFGEIARQAGEREVTVLVDLYHQTKDEGLKWCVRDAVIKIGFANDRVIDLLKDAQSFDGLKKIGAGNARAMTALAELARSSDWSVYFYALEALGDFERGEADATQALGILHEIYKSDTDKYGKRRQQIMIAAKHVGVGNAAATGIFIDGLDDAVGDVVSASIGGLASQDYSSQEEAHKAVDALIELQYQKGSGIEAIANFGRDFPYARQAMLKNLGRFEKLEGEDRRWQLSDYLEVLGQVSLENDVEVEAVLLRALEDQDVFVSSGAVRGLVGPAQRNNKSVAQAIITKSRSLSEDFQYFARDYLEALARIAPDVAETQEFLKEVASNERNSKELREQAARLLADIENRDKVQVNTVRSFQDILAPAEKTQTAHSHRVFLNEKGDLFIFDYRDVQSMAAAQNLFAAFAERKGLAGKILSRPQRAPEPGVLCGA